MKKYIIQKYNIIFFKLEYNDNKLIYKLYKNNFLLLFKINLLEYIYYYF